MTSDRPAADARRTPRQKPKARWPIVLLAACLIHVAVFSRLAGANDRLLEATRAVREMDEATLVALVPEQSGLHFVGCPNCTAGRQENQLEWSIEKPDVVTCRYCRHEYPSAKYPMTEAVVVRTPRGNTARFEYWADETGYRYFFKAHRDDEVRRYLSQMTLQLARLYEATGEEAHARRAALLLDRFAQVFPDWCYHYDYPFRQKEIYDGDVPPEKFRPDFRTARWNWWAYSDIPLELVEAYRLIRDSGALEQLSKEQGVDVAARIENDLLRNAGEQVFANRDNHTNMSPTAWYALVRLGRVLEEPKYVHDVVRRFRRLVEIGFFYDGFWHEGAPSYGHQTVGNLRRVLDALGGYSDPPGYVDPIDGRRFDNLDLEADFPLLADARTVLETMRLPNGRPVPVHDTWATERLGTPSGQQSYLLPALGHAALGLGAGIDRTEVHLTWSGGYGHAHADALSLLLYSHGRELLTDLGYTHTAYRAWTLATAAHNTVVIDGKSQVSGSRDAPTDGRLQLIDLNSPHVQVVSVDGTRAYPGLAQTYRRTLLLVGDEHSGVYAVDVFEVTGGRTHDYFLHGDADGPATATASMPLNEIETLLPDGFQWAPTTNEGQAGRAFEPHFAYGFLRRLRSAAVSPGEAVRVEFDSAGSPEAALQVILLPEDASRLVLGENPSIRGADENDARLEDFQRPFLMLRREADGRPSRFAAVLEPYRTAPQVSEVRRIETSGEAVAIRVKAGDRTDVIVVNAPTEQQIPLDEAGGRQARFRGAIGVLTLRAGEIQHAYALGEGGWSVGDFELQGRGPEQGTLVGADAQSITVRGAIADPPRPGDVVRLLTEDGWVYPYHVAAATRTEQDGEWRFELQEGPGFELQPEGAGIEFHTFPQREHSGEVRVEWWGE